MIKMKQLTAQDLLHYHLIFRNIFKDILRPDKTPISEFEILMVVNEKEGLKVGELSDIMSITRPNLTPLVENLALKDLLVKKKDEIDKRVTRLYITEKGKAQIVENFKVIEERCSILNDKYTEQELKEIKEYCNKIIKIINK